jgi:four helix bundle protein
MSRDHRKLRVFLAADSAVEAVYKTTRTFPAEERFCLQAQLRRAALSVPANIVEGCARRSPAEYVQFLNVATGSAAEAGYLIDLSHRLGFVKIDDHARLVNAYGEVVSGLKALVTALEGQR